MNLATALQEIIIRIVLLFTILFIGFLIGRAVNRIINRALVEAKARNLMKFDFGILLSRIPEFAIYIFTITLITNDLGITMYAVYGLAGLLAIILAVNILIQLTFSIPNIFARISVRKKKLKKGSKFSRKKISGVITRRRLTNVTIVTESGDKLILPYRWIKN